MRKMNNKGFALVETLIVSVFVMTIFTVIYTNFFPMMGEYERRQGYDDIDSIYKTFLVKRMVESIEFKGQNYFTSLSSNPYMYFDISNDTKRNTACTNLMNVVSIPYCKELFTELKATKLYFVKYNTSNLKSTAKSDTSMDSGVKDYVATMPYYVRGNNNSKGLQYRIIVGYEKDINSDASSGDEEDETITVYSYSTIGVDPQ